MKVVLVVALALVALAVAQTNDTSLQMSRHQLVCTCNWNDGPPNGPCRQTVLKENLGFANGTQCHAPISGTISRPFKVDCSSETFTLYAAADTGCTGAVEKTVTSGSYLSNRTLIPPEISCLLRCSYHCDLTNLTLTDDKSTPYNATAEQFGVDSTAWLAAFLNVWVFKFVAENELGVKVVRLNNQPGVTYSWDNIAAGKSMGMLEVWASGQTANIQRTRQQVKFAGNLGAIGRSGWYLQKEVLDQFPQFGTFRGLKTDGAVLNNTVMGVFRTYNGGNGTKGFGTDELQVKGLDLPSTFSAWYVNEDSKGSATAQSQTIANTNRNMPYGPGANQRKGFLVSWWVPEAFHSVWTKDNDTSMQTARMSLPAHVSSCWTSEQRAKGFINCDYPTEIIKKYVWAGLEARNQNLHLWMNAIEITNSDQDAMMQLARFNTSVPSQPEAACIWTRDNINARRADWLWFKICPDDCSGHGTCAGARCTCDMFHYGDNCGTAKEIRYTRFGDGEAITFIILFVIIILFALALAIFILLNRENRHVKVASFMFLEIIIFGVIIAMISIFFWIGEPTDALCHLRVWFASLGFTTVYACIAVKTWRMYRIWAGAEQFKNIKITQTQVFLFLGVFLLFDCVFLGLYSGLDDPHPEYRIEKGEDTEVRYECRHDHVRFVWLLLAYKGVLLVSASVLAFLSRGIKVSNNESLHISLSIFAILVACLIVVPLMYVFEEDLIRQLLVSIAMCVVSVSILVTLPGPVAFRCIAGGDSSSAGSATTGTKGSSLPTNI